MLKIIMIGLIAGALSLAIVFPVGSEVIPTYQWVDFLGDATYNGQPLPVGSVVDAYDPDGVHCGTMVIDSILGSGRYGFLQVYADDPYSESIDEGAESGDPITLYLNGRLATPLGPDDPVWTVDGAKRRVNLAASATTTGLVFENTPGNKFVSPGDTVRYDVEVRNIGDGIDFCTISGSSNHGWIVRPMSGFVYIAPGETAVLHIDLLVPKALFYDMDDILTYRVTSGIDSDNFLESTVVTMVRIHTDVSDHADGIIPQGFYLYQNYPNPFNPGTTIRFDLPLRGEAELQIFDISGRTVLSLDLGVLDAGCHRFEFNGDALASGIYLYRVKAGGASQIRKMTLIK
jgi:hypothetical protein